MRISTSIRAIALVGVLVASPLFAQTLPERTPIAGAWGPNSAVIDSVVVGDTVFIGGGFDYIGPPTGAFATTDMNDGRSVRAGVGLVGFTSAGTSDGAGGWFVVTHRLATFYVAGVAHIRADGSLDAGFVSPSFTVPFGSADVYGLVAAGGRVYVFGTFHAVGGVARRGIAALDASTGAVLPWDAQLAAAPVSTSTYVFRAALDGNILYVTGDFSAIAGQPRQGMAALDADTGALRPATFDNTQGTSVSYLSAAGGRVYASGGCNIGGTAYQLVCAYASDGTELPNWGAVSGEYFGPLVATPSRVYILATQYFPGFGNVDIRARGFDPVTGTQDGWQSPAFRGQEPGGLAMIDALAVGGGRLFASGTFETVGGVRRTRFAAIDTSTGALTPWAPAVAAGANALVSDGSRVAIIGAFASAGGRYASGLAALDLRTGLPASVPLPAMPGLVRALAASGSLVVAGAGESIVAFSAVTGAEQARFEVSAAGKPAGTTFALAIAEPYLFVGGNFVDLRGQPRRNLGAIDMRTGQATAFDPRPDNQVYKLRVSSGAVYAVGAFRTVPGLARAGVAAWEIASGALEQFSPPEVATQDVAFYKDRVMLAGYVNPSGASSTRWVGRVAGEPLPFGQATSFDAYSVARTADTLVVGGDPTFPLSNAGIAAIDALSGAALPWSPRITGELFSRVSHVQATPTAVVVAGSFTAVDGAPAHNLAIFPMSRAATPRQMTAAVSGNTLTLGWQPGSGPAASGYVVEVGTTSGGAEVGAFAVGALTRVTGTLPAGTFYARVRGTSAQGTGAPGSEVVVTTPSVSLPPQAPSALAATVANGVVMLSWTAAAGNATTYVVEAGTGPGLSNIGALPLGHLDTSFSTGAPSGTYVIRVRAANAFGTGPASNDVTVVVP